MTPQLGGLLDTNGNGIDLNGGNLDLDNSTAARGNITKNGTPFLHNFGNSTFLGSNAGNFTTTGGANTAVGLQALFNNISGDHNTGDGYGALFMNTSGGNNTASGWFALRNNTTGNNNIALGNDAGMNLATGDNNIAIGNPGGSAAESSTTRIGSLQTRAFIAGIRGVTTDVADAIAVMIDSNGQLGTAPANTFTTNGTRTTGVGFGTLQQTMTGLNNTGMGWAVLVHNTSGSNNVGVGSGATAGNTSGSGNTALGTGALSTNQNGNNNIAIGHEVSFTANGISNSINVGGPQTIGSGDMVLGTQGTQTRTFIAGIRGITTVNADAITVMIDSAGQLGTVSSSLRYKLDVRDMGDVTDALMRLRPVTFRYKHVFAGGAQPLQYGLIAEEVAEIFPDLVVFNEEGLPETVQYRKVNAMLLNEVQKLHVRTEEQQQVIDDQGTLIEELLKRVEALESGRGAEGQQN